MRGSILSVAYLYSVNTAISSGTSKKTKIATISFTDTNHYLNWDALPNRMTCALAATGPLATHSCTNWSSDGEGTYTADIYLCGVLAGSMATGNTFNATFNTVVQRNLHRQEI